MGVAPQVIYKKFNIPCPLDVGHHNVTPTDSHALINATDFCEAKLVTMNSQVRSPHCQLCFYLLVSGADPQPHVLLSYVLCQQYYSLLRQQKLCVEQTFDCLTWNAVQSSSSSELQETHWPLLCLTFRQLTPSQFWPLLLSATPRCYQSTLSYESKS